MSKYRATYEFEAPDDAGARRTARHQELNSGVHLVDLTRETTYFSGVRLEESIPDVAVLDASPEVLPA
jgi:hypothetical protein